MSSSYHHAISNRLFLALSPDELSFCITDKNLAPLKHGDLSASDSDMLKQVLTNTAHLNQIFEQVVLTFKKYNFLCVPPIFSNTEDKAKVFQTSQRLADDEQLVDGQINSEASLLFAIEQDKIKVVKEVFPRLTYGHEIETFYQFTQSEIKPMGQSLFLKQQHDDLLFLVTNNKELRLANRFSCQSREDLFYYAMLAMEQLEIDGEHASLYWSKNDAFLPFEQVEALFQDYISSVRLIDHKNSFDPVVQMRIQCG